ncbi:MAG: acyl-homoserine-lactone synthase [Bdellovibrionales bacterium]
MIEVAQAGQGGKTSLLFSMHRLRARVFKDKMQWDVNVDGQGLEVDEFDLPQTVYVLALDDNRTVIGNWRMVPTSGPTMIRNLWPQFLGSIEMPSSDDVWEVSRFTVNSTKGDTSEGKQEAQQAIAELFCAMTELCMRCGIKEIYTMYDNRIARMIQRLDCQPHTLSEPTTIEGAECRVGAFYTDANMLSRIRAATGIQHSVIESIELPPILEQRAERKAHEARYGS